MKGRKAIRNARPKATFDGPQDGQQGGHKLLGEGNYKIISDTISSMTTLLMHTVAHSTKPSFMPKTNNQPPKKFLSLALS